MFQNNASNCKHTDYVEIRTWDGTVINVLCTLCATDFKVTYKGAKVVSDDD